MSQQLHFGDRGILNVQIPESILDEEFSSITPPPLDNPAEAIASALNDPLGYPALTRTLVPGDRIAIALDRNVPRSGELFAGLVNLLSESDHLQECQLHLVFAGTDSELAELELDHLLPADQLKQLTIQLHCPNDASRLSYLAAADDGKPVYINRTLCDADMVLPIVTLGLEGQLGYAGIHEALFRSFSDTKTQQRFLAPDCLDSGQLRAEADEAAWLLGIQLVLGVIPGAGDSILHVLAGDAREVHGEAELLGQAAWSRPARQAELVVATIEGRQGRQDWMNLARALHSASQLVSEGGMIVLCTELDCPPGAALWRRVSQQDDSQQVDDADEEASPDAIAAEELRHACQRARVYLLSKLSQDLVEDLGIAYLGDEEEVTRLVNQCESCIVLVEADRTIIALP